MKYYNPKNGRTGIVNKIKLHGKTCYIADYNDEKTGCGMSTIKDTFNDAEMVMVKLGYKRCGMVDESGARRYTMTVDELQSLYKRFENFVADCTQQEYNENKSAIIAVYTLIKKHIDAEIKK